MIKVKYEKGRLTPDGYDGDTYEELIPVEDVEELLLDHKNGELNIISASIDEKELNVSELLCVLKL